MSFLSGHDHSGNGNSFDSAYLVNTDQMLDTPTNNFCTMNSTLGDALNKTQDGNLTITGTNNNYAIGTIAFGSSGKFYAEANIVNDGGNQLQIATMFAGGESNLGGNENSYYDSGVIYKNASQESTGNATYTTGDIIAISVDVPNATVRFYKNNSLIKTLTSVVDLQEDSYGGYFAANATKVVFNFGQDGTFSGAETSQGNADGNGVGDFFYEPPAGFLALCTNNLPEPTVDAANHFNPVIYSGNSSTNAITGVGFQPDFAWFKCRSEQRSHSLVDSVRGFNGTSARVVQSAGTQVEWESEYINSLNTDGFTLSGSENYINNSSHTYVAWCWKAGNANTSFSESGNNPAGTHRANVPAGFSIVSYTGTGAAGTVAHGLGAAPEMIFIKNRDVDDAWAVYYGDNTDYFVLNTTAATADAATYWNDTSPSSTVFTVNTAHSVNADGEKYIAYCWRSVEGFSKIAQYTGNGDANGTFVNTGFKPAWVLMKRLNNGDQATPIFDSARNKHNVTNLRLKANDTVGELNSDGNIDLLSNGFKARNTDGSVNTDSGIYVYMAVAETPFKYANAK